MVVSGDFMLTVLPLNVVSPLEVVIVVLYVDAISIVLLDKLTLISLFILI